MDPATRVSRLSVEALRAPVGLSAAATVDPTTFAASLALVAVGGEPASGDWQAATWVTIDGTAYPEAVFTMPDAVGKYELWVRIVTPDQTVIRPAGEVGVH